VHFSKYYKNFVLKKDQVSHRDLDQRIRRYTQQLKRKYTDDEDIKFTDMVFGDVKKLISAMLFMLMRFYSASLNNDIVITKYLQDRFVQLITKLVLEDKRIYNIVLSSCRYETTLQQKLMFIQMKKYSKKQLETQDLHISRFFLLND